MWILTQIAERRIQEAIDRGELDDLSLKGQPIPHDDDSNVPEELRMGYKVLKNAGYLPEELELRREIITLRQMIDSCRDPAVNEQTRRRLTLRQIRYDMLMERNGRSVAYQQYEAQLTEKLLER